jgi:tripartite-type tricarboxylate transporter receptor subunit TctC
VKENGASGREAARCLTGGGRFPPGPPSDIVKRLNDAANKVLTSSTTIEQLRQVGVNPMPVEQRSTKHLKSFIGSVADAWRAAVKANGIATSEECFVTSDVNECRGQVRRQLTA